jgi:GTP-binding protein
VSDDPDAGFLEAGRKLFAGEVDFFFAAAKVEGLPPVGAPEVAFAGRSNVGKSSLINALTGRNSLARASNTPGRTRELIFFDVAKRLTLVDMPGYGYASVGKEMSAGWIKLVRDYLRGRTTLMRAFVLVDGRHGVKPSDEETFASLDKTAVSYAVVLTKRDEVKLSEQAARLEATTAALAKHPAAYPSVFFTSAQTGEGVPELRAHVARLLAQREGGAAAGTGRD